jgi:hypothetical protein
MKERIKPSLPEPVDIYDETDDLYFGMDVLMVTGRKTKYDDDCMIVHDADTETEFLISGNEIMKMMNEFAFEVIKKRKWSYLKVCKKFDCGRWMDFETEVQ